MKQKRRKKHIWRIIATITSILLLFYLLQRFCAHRSGYFVPDYPKLVLTQDSDYETIFLQTGLSRSAVDKLIAANNFEAILEIQDTVFSPPEPVCVPLLGWFTREDRTENSGIPLVDLQPGDIILTLSTHTAGWHHGHAGLVINSDTTLESIVLGTDSTPVNIDHWTSYSNFAVLRLKNITPQLQQEVVTYSLNHLLGLPYRLFAGLIGPKAPDPDTTGFGLHCSYLVWYAWQQFGYDLDSDGGRLTTAYDLLHSDLLEIVQLYGMDPRTFG